MTFTSKRGRKPTLKLTESKAECKDLGTAELAMKRALNLTKEALDLCLERRIISDEQHKSAIRFRWLYTIRFGAPNISALNMDKFEQAEFREDDEEWRLKREQEYSMMIEKLRKCGALKIVMNIVIFNHLPRFLTGAMCHLRVQAIQNAKEISKFREGLNELIMLDKLNKSVRYNKIKQV